jgi:hypothetical protein
MTRWNLFKVSPFSYRGASGGRQAPEHFQEKWNPVFRPEMRQTNKEHFQEKWNPVFRPEMRQTNQEAP